MFLQVVFMMSQTPASVHGLFSIRELSGLNEAVSQNWPSIADTFNSRSTPISSGGEAENATFSQEIKFNFL